MRRIALAAVLLAAGVGRAQLPVTNVIFDAPAPAGMPAILPAAPPAHHAPAVMPALVPSAPPPAVAMPAMPALPAMGQAPCAACEAPPMAGHDAPSRGLFESDRAFCGFIGPISNPILAKDPRSLTELRGLFVNNWFPEGNSVLGGGELQAYGLQARLALTDRLSFIADKDGYASLHARNLPHQNGWLNINAGLKYLLVRDVENQTLWSVGATYEPPTGESKVFQRIGSGLVTAFTTFGQEFGDTHVLLNGGYQFGLKEGNYSDFLYGQIHVDRRFFGWLYPLAEFNFFGYTSGGRNFPAGLGEGDGLINFGTNGRAGRTFVTFAVGLKAQVTRNLDVGVAWDTPLGDKNITSQRLLVEAIFRY